jgi:hypothetical protein
VLADPGGGTVAVSGQRPAVGVLADGTAHYAPIGQVLADESRVICHLCGCAFRSVAAHLPSHGWTKSQYCDAFGLERQQSLEGSATRKLRAAAFSARLVFEPAVREGSARGRDRARRGELTRDAANAARGRPFPEQRRQKSRDSLPAAARVQLGLASRQRADRQLAIAAEDAARRAGYDAIGELVLDRLGAGQSLASISLECGLGKDWLSRHLPRLDPAVSAAAGQCSAQRADARWADIVARVGFADVGSYLRQRHLVEHLSINAIASEAGVSFPTVKSALQRHGVDVWPHAAKRHAAERRRLQVAARLGVESIADFIDRCRARGLTWREMAAECGEPEAWLRRQAASASSAADCVPAARD